MAINLRETFQVQAPVEAVWRFMMDPEQVVACVPGAQLQEVVDDKTFLGTVKVKVGAITASYKGRVRFAEVDEQGYKIQMAVDGRDPGGGTAKGTVSGSLRPLSDDCTEVVAEASVDLTGRIMQVGRGMIQGVSHQLFQQFAASTKARLEAQQGAMAAQPVATENTPISIVPLILRTMWLAVVRFVRKLFGRSGR